MEEKIRRQKMFEKIILKLRKIHLIYRLQIISVILPVIICMTIIILLGISSYSAIRKNELKHVKMTEDMIRYNVNSFLESILTPINALTTKTSFIALVDNYNDVIESNNWTGYTGGISDEIFAYYADNTEINSVEIVGEKKSITFFPANITAGELEKSEFMKEMITSQRRIRCFGKTYAEALRTSQNKKREYIIIGVQIKSRVKGDVIGALFVAIDSDKFLKKITMEMEESIYNIIIKTSDGTPVAAKICENEELNLKEKLWKLPQTQKELLKVNQTRYLTSQSVTDLLGWKIQILTNYDQMVRSIIHQILICVLIAFMFVIVLSVVTFMVSESVVQPVNRLVKTMKKAELTTDIAYLEPDGSDELTYLVKSFNEMSEKMYMLFKKNMEVQDHNRKIQLDSLQAQINPHMLYNTLDSINWMAYLSGTNKICDIIQNLSDFYRLTLNQGKIFQSLDEELNQVECYLKLEQFVYNQAIRYTINRKKEIYAEEIPRIILQPIVENAIMHAFTSAELEINIEAFHIPKYLLICIEDNGEGISYIDDREVKVEDLRTNTSSYGLNNINERIKLIYGNEYGIRLQNGKNCGLSVKIYLPESTLTERKGAEKYDNFSG